MSSIIRYQLAMCASLMFGQTAWETLGTTHCTHVSYTASNERFTGCIPR
jgi:hypothetical protein